MGDPVTMDASQTMDRMGDEDHVGDTGMGPDADGGVDTDPAGGPQVGTRTEKVGTMEEPSAARTRRPRRERGAGGSGLSERAAEFRAQAKEFRAQAESAEGHHADNLMARADRADAAADRMEAAAGRLSGGDNMSGDDGTIGDDSVGAAGGGADAIVGDGMSTEDTPAPGSGGTVVGASGQIILEAEDGSSSGSWVQREVDGRQVMVWAANDHSYDGVNEGETMSFNFTAAESGSFNVGLNSTRLSSDMLAGERGQDDKGNDVYFRLTNQTTGEVVQAPTKLFTYFGNADGQFRMGREFDNHGKSTAGVSLNAGDEYTLDIIGRSPGYALDKVVLSKGALPDDAADLTPEAPMDDDPITPVTGDEVTDLTGDEPDIEDIDEDDDTEPVENLTEDMPAVNS